MSVLPGQRLREAREKAGLSQEEVARRLHLSTTFVRALENDDYDRLPEAIFIKGYLRNYARLLALPPDDVANLFQQVVDEETVEQQDEPVRPLKTPLQDRRTQSWMVGAAALVVVAVLVWAGARQDEADIVTAGAVAEEREAVGPEMAQEVDEPEFEQDADRESAPADGADAPQDGAPEVEVDDDAAIAVAEAESVPLDRLSVTFNDDCWVRVVDAAGEEIHTGVEGAGSMLTLDGRGPFRLTLGNAAAVDTILMNGNPVPVPEAAPGRVRTLRVQ